MMLERWFATSPSTSASSSASLSGSLASLFVRKQDPELQARDADGGLIYLRRFDTLEPTVNAQVMPDVASLFRKNMRHVNGENSHDELITADSAAQVINLGFDA